MIKRMVLLLSALCLFNAAWADFDFSAVCSTGQTLYYNNNSNGTLTVTYPSQIGNPWSGKAKPTGTLVIPDQVNGKTVSAIDDMTFYRCDSLLSVTIPTSITSIGSYAFGYCSMLQDLNLPATLSYIPDHMCCNCVGLPSISIPSSCTVIGEVAFDHCESLTSVAIPSSVTFIGSSAFSHCIALADIDLGNVKVIDYSAFNNCTALASLTIPESVDTLRSAFFECPNLQTINFNARNCVMGDEYSSAFPINETVTSVTIGPAVQSLDREAFFGFKVLTSVVIPDNVQSIGDEAFAYDYALNSVTIGSGVRTIGADAFSCDRELDSIIMRCTPPQIQSSTFILVPKDLALIVPCGQASAYRAASCWSDFTNIIEDCGNAAVQEPDQPQVVTALQHQQIILSVSQPLHVRLIDIMGRTLFNQQVSATTQIPVPAPGLYILQTPNAAPVRLLVP